MYQDSIAVDLDDYPDRMTTEQVAKALSITVDALNVQLSRGTIVIPFIRIGKRREFLKTHVELYLESKYREASERANQELEKAS